MPRDRPRHIIRIAVPSLGDRKLSCEWAAAFIDRSDEPQRVGYARVSSPGQSHELQLHALKAHGCDSVFTDCISGKSSRREGLSHALARCRAGDELVVWGLDRIGRDLVGLIGLYDALTERGVTLQVLTGRLKRHDTGCPEGRTIFAILAALAALESDMTSQRTLAGLAARQQDAIALSRDFAMRSQG